MAAKRLLLVVNRFLVASHLIDFHFVQWGSAESRAAHQDVVESLAVLVDGRTDNPDRWISRRSWRSAARCFRHSGKV